MITRFSGTAASSFSFPSQKASKSAGLGSAARIPVGATAAPSRMRPGPPVLLSPNVVSGFDGLISTTTIAGSFNDVSMRPRPFERSSVPVVSTSPPLRRIVYGYDPRPVPVGIVTVHPTRSPAA